MPTLKIKRVYEQPDQDDGTRILVDRLWPRGLSKKKAKVDYWAKELAPSTELRKWYGHDAARWDEFKNRYAAELDQNTDAINELLDNVGQGTTTFLFSSKEPELNNARALKEYLESRRLIDS